MATSVSPKRNVRVLYNYDFDEKDGRHVSIKSGDECILIQKTNDEWWFVLRCGEKNGIFVPANHLQEIHKTTIVVDGCATGPPKVKPKPARPPPVPKKPKPPLIEDDVLKELDNMLEHALDFDDIVDDDEGHEMTEYDAGADNSAEDENDYINVSKTKMGTDANANRVKKEINCVTNPAVSLQPSDTGDGNDAECRTTDNDLPEYANLEAIQDAIFNRPSSDRESPQLPNEGATVDGILVGGWEQHCDEEGRTYYFNPVTKDSQWAPPSGGSVASDGDRSSVPDDRSLQRTASLPQGWTEEQSDTGDVFLLNDVTKERWQSSRDESGRIYYFRENSSGESSWDLPEGALTTKESESDSTTPQVHRTDADGASGSNIAVSSSGGVTETNSDKQGATRLREHRGSLNRKKLMEGNKRLKKNWSQCYVVTTGQMLYFYKDQKAATPKPNQPMGKPEVTIDLRDAEITFGSKIPCNKKNVITVVTSSGTDEYLLQCDTPEAIHEWYQTLKQNVDSLTKCSDRPKSLTLPRSADSLSSVDTSRRSPVIDSPTSTASRRKMYRKVGTATLDGTNTSGSLTFNDEGDNSNRIKDWLSNWFKKRPAVETLRAKGIIQDAVFGSHLQSLCELEGSKVPHFVTECIAAIEKKGLATDGLYRVSGNLAEIQKLKFRVNQDDHSDFLNSEFDLHVLTGALKMFFRELKEPLFPFNTFDKFMNAIKVQNKSTRAQAFRDLVKVLPSTNKETMKALFSHLLRVVDCSRENRMQIQNVAIVFGPTLLSPERPAENVATTLVLQNQIVDFILHEFKRLF